MLASVAGSMANIEVLGIACIVLYCLPENRRSGYGTQLGRAAQEGGKAHPEESSWSSPHERSRQEEIVRIGEKEMGGEEEDKGRLAPGSEYFTNMVEGMLDSPLRNLAPQFGHWRSPHR